MRFTLASLPARPDRPNEDFVGVTADAAVLLDGAGLPEDMGSGCSHGAAWYARMLGSTLLAAMNQHTGSLIGILAEGIKAVTSAHDFVCDLLHPASPAATVVMLRRRGQTLEWLVLCDSVLLIDLGGAGPPLVITDQRDAWVATDHRAAMEALPIGTPERDRAHRAYLEALLAHRNRDGGYWVAATDPLAAEQAITGSIPVPQVHAVALLSDGAARLVDRFDLIDWREVLNRLAQHGPERLLHDVREAERSDPDGVRWRRSKIFDDASVIYGRF